MAKVTFINAIVQGKLDGAVYSRNKGGYYMKGYTKPLNPDSQAQIAVRAIFAAAASSWHALSDARKAAWNSYALVHYKPKTMKMPLHVSGFQAYVALYTGVMNGNSRARVNEITAPVGVTYTADPLAFEQDPPSAEFSSMIQDSVGAPLPLFLEDASFVSATGEVTIQLGFGAEQTTAPQFIDAVGAVEAGIIVQMSRAMTQAAQFVQNKTMTIVNVIQPPTAITGWAASNHITFRAHAADIDPTKFKLWPTAGEKVQMTVGLIGKKGQQAPIGGITIDVT